MSKAHDYIIIGAGPAGLQLGYYLNKAKRDYLILESGESPCTFFKEYPRHRTLLSVNKVYTGYDDEKLNLRWDWNSLLNDEGFWFKKYSDKFLPDADDLVDYMCDFAKEFDLNIQLNTLVKNVAKDGDTFILTDANGETYETPCLIVATGVPKAYVPAIPGADLVENYTNVTIDPMDYKNQRVLIIGKGNSSFEFADSIIGTAASIHLSSPNVLKLAWKSHHVGHLRAVNNNFLDTYLLKMQNGLLEAEILNIEKLENGKLRVTFSYTRAHGQTGTHDYDRVILCGGFCFDASFFDDSCKPKLALNDRFPAQTSEWESTNIKNLFFMGTIMQMRDFKKTQSSFIHGFRYNIRALASILEKRFHNTTWPHTELAAVSQEVGGHILERLNRSASLWHQPGFLCDLIVMKDDKMQYYYDLPMDYVSNSEFSKEADYYVISLEYGPDSPDFPFEFNRFINQENAHLNPQLHPIIRRYNGSEVIAEHHILEEIEGRWYEPMFTEPLYEFLDEQLAVGV